MKGFVIWFTGLSGVGKTTLADRTKQMLERWGNRVDVLDGDIVRKLSGSQVFSREGRARNVRSVGEKARELADSGSVVICALISPYEEDRLAVRRMVGAGRFALVYLDSNLDTLIDRDTKGLYRKALSGEIANFTGISDPYEAPSTPDLVLSTDMMTVEECADILEDFMQAKLQAVSVARIPVPEPVAAV